MACGDEGLDFDSDFDSDKPLNSYSKFQTSGDRRPVYALRATPRQAASTRIYQERNLYLSDSLLAVLRTRERKRVRARRTFTAEKKKQSVLLDSGVRRNDESLTKNEPNDLNIISDKGLTPQEI